MRCTVAQLNEARAAKNDRRCRGEQTGGRWKPAERGPEQTQAIVLDELEAAFAEIAQALAIERQNEDEMLALYMQLNAETAKGETCQEIPF